MVGPFSHLDVTVCAFIDSELRSISRRDRHHAEIVGLVYERTGREEGRGGH